MVVQRPEIRLNPQIFNAVVEKPRGSAKSASSAFQKTPLCLSAPPLRISV
jgi:hypothetical protein